MKKPVKKDGKIEAINYNSVILEEVRDNVKGVAEGVMILDEKLDRHIKNTDDNFKNTWDRLDKHILDSSENFNAIKAELAIIRHNQVTRDEFKLLETRVLQLERRAVR